MRSIPGDSHTMPTHLVFESVAARLERGEYSPAIARRMTFAVPAVHTAHGPQPMRQYAAELLGSALLGALVALAFFA